MLKFSRKIHFKKPSWENDFLPHEQKIIRGDIIKIYQAITGNKIRSYGHIVRASCPFHAENFPSFTLYPDTSSAYCFGCHWGGDSIKMVMEIKNISFKEALQFIKSI